MQATLVYLAAPAEMRSRLLGVLSVCIGVGPVGFVALGLLADARGGALGDGGDGCGRAVGNGSDPSVVGGTLTRSHVAWVLLPHLLEPPAGPAAAMASLRWAITVLTAARNARLLAL